MLQAVNRHVLTIKNPCINQTIHLLLIHEVFTLEQSFKNLRIRHAFACHYNSNTNTNFQSIFQSFQEKL